VSRFSSKPWRGSPSFQQSASVPLEKRRATCCPRSSSGTRPRIRNQAVDHTGPQRKPGSTGRYSARLASSRPMRSAVWKTSAVSGAQSGCTAGRSTSPAKFSKGMAA